MVIKELNPLQLKDFISSDEFRKLKTLPISSHRALSHIHNPRVDKDDIILLVAYDENGDMVGYLGVFADKIYLNNKEFKAGWLSCLWIDPRMRGKGIAKKLLNRALKAWNNNILITEFTPAAKNLYDNSAAFTDLFISKGIRGYLRFNLNELLPVKIPFLAKFHFLLKAVDGFFNFFNDARLLYRRNMISLRGDRIEYVNQIDGDIESFIKNKQLNQLTRRQANDLSWIINYPWISSSPAAEEEGKKYHFSYYQKNFLLLNIKLYDSNNKLIGFLMLNIRGKNLKIPYCYFEEKNVESVAAVIFKEMLDRKLNMLTVFNKFLVDYITHQKSPFIIKRTMKRHYLISKTFEMADSVPDMQDGDADCAFT